MSLSRVRWEKRGTETSDEVAPTYDLPPPDWDEDAIQEAEYRARALAPFDPDAAATLRQQAAAARKALVGQVRAPYDPMKAYARMAKYYGFSHSEMEQMHFITFFGYVREANTIIEEDKEQFERERRRATQGTTVDHPEQLGSLFPQARAYEGETVAIR